MITLIIGPMFAGKSTYLLNEERKAIITKKNSICVKHSIDNRYTKVFPKVPSINQINS